MFVDSVTITVKAGDGGNGAATFRRDANTSKGGPDGGNGGNGGDVYIQASRHLNDLREFRFKKSVQADRGVDGMGKNLFGKNAEDLTIFVPIGTEVTDLENNRTFLLVDPEKKLRVVKGGNGGRGNWEFRSATNQAPTYAEKGGVGEQKKIQLELKIIADIGLVGLPNAGKSSLLASLTNAKPAIGNYPFTTLEPNLGIMGSRTIADIPGLIAGASTGKGLGVKFLKHIEKTKVLVHCIDVNEEDPLMSYDAIRKEFGEYNESLLSKQEIIVLTKIDTADKKTIEAVETLFKKMKKNVIQCSIYDQNLLDALVHTLSKIE